MVERQPNHLQIACCNAGSAISMTSNNTSTMNAAVYRGNGRVVIEHVDIPEISQGELLVRVECCGICHTDLKKIEYDLLPAPRIYGHETSGVVVATGENVLKFAVGDRVCMYHHIPCFECHYCKFRDYSQCAKYKQVGVTAGFEPAGGGFAQYVRVMDWIVEKGVEKIPEYVSFEQATFVEPVNTCLKGLAKCKVEPEESVLIMGQGPIGLLFTTLLQRQGVQSVVVSDLLQQRLTLARQLGASETWQADLDPTGLLKNVTEGRGFDVVIVAASAEGIVKQAVSLARRGGRIMLFAQTSPHETFLLNGKSICADDRTLFGSYSACADVQQLASEIVWDHSFPAKSLISHNLSMKDFNQGISLARQPDDGTLKLLVHPQE